MTSRQTTEEPVPDGYKRTEVGVIPKDWNCIRTGDEVDLLTGFPFPSSGYSQTGVLLVRGSNVKRGQLDWQDDITKYWPTASPDINRFGLQKGDIVIAMDGALIGRSYAVISDADLPSLLVQRVARIRSFILNQRLIVYWVGSNSFVNYVDSVKTHSAIPHISPADICNFLIAVPTDQAEQTTIANALSDVDKLITSLEKLIAKKRAIKLATMQQLLTGKTRLPGFSGKWETKRLGEIAIIRNQKVFPGNVSPDTLCVELEHIGQRDGRLLVYSSARYSTSSKYRFFAGDVLFGRLRSYLRKFWHADQDGICTTEIWPLMIDPKLGCSGFLHAIVQTDRFIEAASISYGTHMPRADWGVMKNFKVDLPEVAEQIAMAKILYDMDVEINVIEHRLIKTKAVKQGMMQQLLTGRIRLVKPQGSA